MSIITPGGIRLHDNSWHTVKHPRVWHLGARVTGFVHPNGRMYKRFYVPGFVWKTCARTYSGTLIKNEWNEGGGIVYPRYTVKCDDGKVRKFQYIRKEI